MVHRPIVIGNTILEAGATAVFNRRLCLESRDIILFYHGEDYRIGMLEKTWPDLWTVHCPDYGMVGIRPADLRCLGVYVRCDDFYAVTEIETEVV